MGGSRGAAPAGHAVNYASFGPDGWANIGNLSAPLRVLLICFVRQMTQDALPPSAFRQGE